MSEKFEMDGTIRSLDKLNRRKKDIVMNKGKMTVMNEEGDKAVIEGNLSVINGMNPEDQVTVVVTKTNKTLDEAIAAPVPKGGKKK